MLDNLTRIGLQEAGGAEQASSALGDKVGWDLEGSQIAILVRHGPLDKANTLDRQASCNPFKTKKGRRLVNFANKVLAVG